MPKSTKAIKVTDAKKAWNKKIQPSAYKVETIAIKKTILIVCEGQTEKLYFESFPVLGAKIKAVDLMGQAKLKLVEATKEIVHNMTDKYEEIWCVFDMDVKRGATEFSDFDNAIARAISLGYKVAYSNDAFELWFYLHFDLSETQQLRHFYYKELGKKFGINYVKEGKKYAFSVTIYNKLVTDSSASQQKAIERARTLFEKQKQLPYHKQNPTTKVYELVDELNRNLRR
jgi:RloB-like protein